MLRAGKPKNLQKGIKRLTLLVSIIFGFIQFILATKFGYTLRTYFGDSINIPILMRPVSLPLLGWSIDLSGFFNNLLDSPLVFWLAGFAAVWAVYAVVWFLIRGFIEENELEKKKRPLPKDFVTKVSWRTS